LHSTDCALIKGDCPFCEENNNEWKSNFSSSSKIKR
jgi:hypothetical protein